MRSSEERDHGGTRLRHDLGGPGLESRVHEGEPPTDEYRRRTPEKVFGGSIYLFREDGP